MVCRAGDEFVGLEVPVEAVVELFVPLDDEFVADVEDPEEAVEALAALGRKVLLPTPKPIAAASLPLPPMKIELVSSLLVMTN